MLRIDLDITIRRYEIILALIILLLTGSVFIAPPERERPVFVDNRYPYRIALTFDDGPHPYFTDRLLTLLKKEHVRATFFTVGRLVMEYPYLVQEISLAGHELAGHSFTHRNLSRLSDDEVRRELSITRGMIEDLSGKRVPYFRPPGGQYNQRVVSLGKSMGLSMVLWSVFPKDHEEPSSDVIVDRVLQQATDGGIVLLHSGVEATYNALPRIVSELRKRGYRFVTISELNKQKNVAAAKEARY